MGYCNKKYKKTSESAKNPEILYSQGLTSCYGRSDPNNSKDFQKVRNKINLIQIWPRSHRL